MNMLMPLERTLSETLVKQKLQEILREQGLIAHFDFQSQLAEVTHVMLLDKKGKIVSEGSGKGPDHEIGAIAEAIEHLCLEIDIYRPGLQLSAEGVSRQKLIAKDKIINEACYKSKNISCKTKSFKTINGQVCLLPEVYINPFVKNIHNNFFESVLVKYATNSGTSFGVCFEDACLHSLNEIIERHYTSLFYLALMGFKINQVWKRYKTMAENQNHKVDFVNNHFDGKLITIMTETEFDVYVAISVFVSDKYSMTPLTAGCSLNLEYAAARSIDEMSQYLCLYNSEEKRADEHSKNNLNTGTRLQRLIQINEETLDLFANGSLNSGYFNNNLSPTEQLNLIVTQLKRKGYNFLYRSLKQFEDGSEVVQALVPGLERFNLIRSGNMVAPQIKLEI